MKTTDRTYKESRFAFLVEHLSTPHGLMDVFEAAELREKFAQADEINVALVLSDLEFTHTQDHSPSQAQDDLVEYNKHEH